MYTAKAAGPAGRGSALFVLPPSSASSVGPPHLIASPILDSSFSLVGLMTTSSKHDKQ